MEHLTGVIAVLCVFGIPIIAILTSHQRKVLEMKLQLRGQGDNNLRAELEALRHEVRSLRDTSTQYDLSFDTALQRMEQRVSNVERNVRSSDTQDVMQVGGIR